MNFKARSSPDVPLAGAGSSAEDPCARVFVLLMVGFIRAVGGVEVLETLSFFAIAILNLPNPRETIIGSFLVLRPTTQRASRCCQKEGLVRLAFHNDMAQCRN